MRLKARAIPTCTWGRPPSRWHLVAPTTQLTPRPAPGAPLRSPPSPNQETSPQSGSTCETPGTTPTTTAPHWAPSSHPCCLQPPRGSQGVFSKHQLELAAHLCKNLGRFPISLIKATTGLGPRRAQPRAPPHSLGLGLPGLPLARTCVPGSLEGSSPASGTAVPGASPVATSRVMAEVSRSTGRSMVLPSGVGVSVRLCDLSSSRSSWRCSSSSRSSSSRTWTSAGGEARAQHAHWTALPRGPPLAALVLTHSLVLSHPPRQRALMDQLLLGDIQVLEAGRSDGQ